MGVACLEFRGENFRGWRKNREIRESFLPRKFPAIRYYVSCLTLYSPEILHALSAVDGWGVECVVINSKSN